MSIKSGSVVYVTKLREIALDNQTLEPPLMLVSMKNPVFVYCVWYDKNNVLQEKGIREELLTEVLKK